jgi:Fe-S cluster assembly iron-binding protein IscA
MLTVTDDAATAMRTALERADLPVSTGMRISADGNPEAESDSQPALRLDVATDSSDADKVVEAPGGLQVFIEPDVAPLLEDKVLDGVIEPSGRAAFRIIKNAP